MEDNERITTLDCNLCLDFLNKLNLFFLTSDEFKDKDFDTKIDFVKKAILSLQIENNELRNANKHYKNHVKMLNHFMGVG